MMAGQTAEQTAISIATQTFTTECDRVGSGASRESYSDVIIRVLDAEGRGEERGWAVRVRE
jgi:hypothetical protein